MIRDRAVAAATAFASEAQGEVRFPAALIVAAARRPT